MSSPIPTFGRLRAGIVGAAAGLALLAAPGPAGGAAAQSAAPVARPPGWYSGDSHIHIQQCDTPVNLTMEEVRSTMALRDLDVGAVQLWASRWTPPDFYLSHYAPFITGLEDPVSDAGHKLQFGLEVSGFQASQFGHLQILGMSDGVFPIDSPYPGPILSFYDQALNGYAHVSWFNDYTRVPFFAGTNGAYTAPIDAALGMIDFLEVRNVDPIPGLETITWTGIYYKLLNAGVRISLTGGSDNSCFIPEIGDSRTYARLGPGEPLSFQGWTEAIRAGRTSIAAGTVRFLDLDVDGTGLGGQVNLAAPGTVAVTATLSVQPGVNDAGTLEIMRNAVVVASIPYALPAGGTTTLQANVAMPKSGWLSARCAPGAHTAATYVIVGDRPVADALDAQYWIDYCDDFALNLPDFGVPDAESEILGRIAAARKVYAALLACDLPLPAGVALFGHSAPACDGPIAIGVTAPPEQPFAVNCVNAPPGSPGLLVIGLVANPVGAPILGCSLFIKVGFPYVAIPVTATQGGYAQVPISVPSGKRFYAQWVWLNKPGCGNGGQLAASNAIDITMP